MKILHFVHAMLARHFYQWALREIDPLHPDLPRILERQSQINDKLRRITT